MKRIFISSTLCLIACAALFGQGSYQSKYPDIPIVDVHVHTDNPQHASNYLKVSETIKQKYASNLAHWISMNDPNENLSQVKAANNRMIFATSGVSPIKGFLDVSDEIIAKVRNGYVGLKFWFGAPYRRLQPGEAGITKIDDPRLAPFFSKLEKANVLMTSLHIADPNGPFDNRQTWMSDPVYYWEQIRAFENVVAKYPNLTIVAAHAAWLSCQDAQFDYLRYMLSTYPNFHIDISATCQYMRLSNPNNIRDFYIEYQDRIVFGTDGGRVADDAIESIANQYARFFAILETDQVVEGGYFGNHPTQGLNLPREVLEKIYYKNALRLYPGLKEAMGL